MSFCLFILICYNFSVFGMQVDYLSVNLYNWNRTLTFVLEAIFRQCLPSILGLVYIYAFESEVVSFWCRHIPNTISPWCIWCLFHSLMDLLTVWFVRPFLNIIDLDSKYKSYFWANSGFSVCVCVGGQFLNHLLFLCCHFVSDTLYSSPIK